MERIALLYIENHDLKTHVFLVHPVLGFPDNEIAARYKAPAGLRDG